MREKYKKILRQLPLFLQKVAIDNNWFEKGIYAIFEPHSGLLLYVGKTSSCFIDRWNSHRYDLEHGRHCNKMLQWKYLQGTPFELEGENGESVIEDYGFEFRAIHVCLDDVTNEEICALEDYYIEELKPMYNIVRKKVREGFEI